MERAQVLEREPELERVRVQEREPELERVQAQVQVLERVQVLELGLEQAPVRISAPGLGMALS